MVGRGGITGKGEGCIGNRWRGAGEVLGKKGVRKQAAS